MIGERGFAIKYIVKKIKILLVISRIEVFQISSSTVQRKQV
jgi:hypothetical protein